MLVTLLSTFLHNLQADTLLNSFWNLAEPIKHDNNSNNILIFCFLIWNVQGDLSGWYKIGFYELIFL